MHQQLAPEAVGKVCAPRLLLPVHTALCPYKKLVISFHPNSRCILSEEGFICVGQAKEEIMSCHSIETTTHALGTDAMLKFLCMYI